MKQVKTAGRQEHNPEWRRGRKKFISTYRKPKHKQQLTSPDKMNCASASLSALQIKCLSKLSKTTEVFDLLSSYIFHIFWQEKRNL